MAKILIADDSPMVRKIAKMSLEKGGHVVIEAGDGKEALDQAHAEKPDIVLLDAEMPEMDGWEASKALKGDPATAAIPVLMCTGHDLSDDPGQLTEAGANGFITKPYNAQNLLDTVAKFLPH
jgi:CheY-like chemotaxis protein